MPHLPNYEYTKDVGQDKPTKDVLDVFKREYGLYSDPVVPTRIKPGGLQPSEQQTPFTLE